MRSFSALAAAVCLMAVPALAWNGLGHMAIAYIAWQRLTPAARAEISRLIRLNPDYNQFVAGLPGDAAHQSQRDLRAFMEAATWADMIKGDPAYVSDGPEHGNRAPDAPEAAQNIGYADHFMHKYWHFIDVPFSTDGTPLKQPQDINAETRIMLFRHVLATPKPAGMSDADWDQLRSYDLVWLLHLVGDIHQPLHCVSRFTRTQPDGDAGGNGVQVTEGDWTGRLHGFWDGALGLSREPEDAIAAAKALSLADAEQAGDLDVVHWVAEGVEIAKTVVYSPPIGDGAGPYTLDSAYVAKAKATAADRVALAGARLANVLNASFGK
jgi:S1/P1 Nuclease